MKRELLHANYPPGSDSSSVFKVSLTSCYIERLCVAFVVFCSSRSIRPFVFVTNKVHRKIIANKILYFRKICLTVISRNVLASCRAQLFETCNISLYAIYELVLDSS